MTSELRKDPVVGRWVIIAGERSQRPNPFRSYTAAEPYSPAVNNGEPCPFCPGQEGLTPPEVLAYRYQEGGANAPRWSVRVVPNRYPALRIEGTPDKRAEGLYDRMRGIGAHEVVIEAPEHGSDPTQYSARQMVDVINAYRDRMTDLLHDTRFRYVLVFKNHGAAAGATLAHPHSQIIALPVVPQRIEAELNGARQYFDYRGRCIYCDILAQEIADAERLVVQNSDFVALAPFASRFPFEISIVPRGHDAFFWALTKHQMESLASILQDVLRRYKLALKDPPYNYVIHTAPPGYTSPERYHWQVEVMPKLTDVAGFEWGSGFFINPTPPEDAARTLRDLVRVMDVPEGHLLANPAPGAGGD
jgi:UDPglucose--hexose-1-phosphate uridylyltransferase